MRTWGWIRGYEEHLVKQEREAMGRGPRDAQTSPWYMIYDICNDIWGYMRKGGWKWKDMWSTWSSKREWRWGGGLVTLKQRTWPSANCQVAREDIYEDMRLDTRMWEYEEHLVKQERVGTGTRPRDVQTRTFGRRRPWWPPKHNIAGRQNIETFLLEHSLNFHSAPGLPWWTQNISQQNWNIHWSSIYHIKYIFCEHRTLPANWLRGKFFWFVEFTIYSAVKMDWVSHCSSNQGVLLNPHRPV